MVASTILAIILIFIGVVLVALDIAVIPSFGVLGILGIAIAGFSILFIGKSYGSVAGVAAVSLSAIAGVVFTFSFFRGRLARRLIQAEQITGDSSKIPSLKHLVGRTGTVTKPLRPSGEAVIDGEPYDVVSEGAFIALGEAVVLIRISNNSLVVEKTQEGR